jgi:hypothetical protein
MDDDPAPLPAPEDQIAASLEAIEWSRALLQQTLAGRRRHHAAPGEPSAPATANDTPATLHDVMSDMR